MKTLLSDQLGASAACPRPVRLGHITTLSALFNQLRAGRPPRCRQIFSERRFRDAAGAGFAGAMPTSGPALSAALAQRLSRGKPLVRRWCLSVQLRRTCRPAQLCFAGGGGERIRTDDLLLAKQALSQLSYTPIRDRQTQIADQKF
jgi:hypothetical protein